MYTSPVLRIERHRLPAMGAQGAGQKLGTLAGFVVANPRVFDRPPGPCIDAAGPGHRCEILGRDELSGLAVEDVEEPVLVGLHQHLPPRPLDGQICQDQLLDGVKIPLLAGCRLKMPGIGAGIGIDGHDRR